MRLLLVLLVALGGTILTLPNLGLGPAVLVARADGTALSDADRAAIVEIAGGPATLVRGDDDALTVRFDDADARRQAAERLAAALPNHIVTYTVEPGLPWLRTLGLRPVSLGLDLRGGVHFTYQADLDTVRTRLVEGTALEIERSLRELDLRAAVNTAAEGIAVRVERDADVASARTVIDGILGSVVERAFDVAIAEDRVLTLTPRENVLAQRSDAAMRQNVTTLRNRIDELGLAEPVVARQGVDRVIVQIPGAGDPAQVRRILSSTATLAWHLEDIENDAALAARRGRAPPGSMLRETRNGAPILLRNRVIVTGDELTDASFAYIEGQPAVTVQLDTEAARRMLATTQANVGRLLAVLLIEDRIEASGSAGELRPERTETVIFSGRIDGVFSSSFRLTGLAVNEARDLAVLLRSGALAVPIYEVAPAREVSPTLGDDNIRRGAAALVTGFALVAAFMALYYRAFGLIADAALVLNVVLIFGLLSWLGAALTLPGLAGIVLTIGMAVDANVLIFERIREHLRAGHSPSASIRQGYEGAFRTIADANVTTLIAALVLFTFGTGPIARFAVTLSLGVATSMFTAIVATRALVDWLYSDRSRETLPIGGIGPRP